MAKDRIAKKRLFLNRRHVRVAGDFNASG
jgi:hypothetical protein